MPLLLLAYFRSAIDGMAAQHAAHIRQVGTWCIDMIPLGTCPWQTKLVHDNCVSEVCHGTEDGLFVLCDRCSVLLSPHKLRS